VDSHFAHVAVDRSGDSNSSPAARRDVGSAKRPPTIQQIDLETQGDAPGLDEERFRELSETAKAACAVSRALRGVARIGVSATVAALPEA
jgi:organic hydroperoxide reductase OsmC/OhrA